MGCLHVRNPGEQGAGGLSRESPPGGEYAGGAFGGGDRPGGRGRWGGLWGGCGVLGGGQSAMAAPPLHWLCDSKPVS